MPNDVTADIDALAAELPLTMTTKELAAIVGLDHRTLRNRRSKRQPPRSLTAGRRVIYTRAAVLEWLRDCAS